MIRVLLALPVDVPLLGAGLSMARRRGVAGVQRAIGARSC